MEHNYFTHYCKAQLTYAVEITKDNINTLPIDEYEDIEELIIEDWIGGIPDKNKFWIIPKFDWHNRCHIYFKPIVRKEVEDG